MLFLVSRQEVAKKRAKGKPLVPGSAQIGVTLSLHSHLRKGLQIQILRWRFDVKTLTRKTNARCEGKSFCSP
jgi:hypothetical protein